MSLDFSILQGITIPEGVVTQITDASGNVLWMSQEPIGPILIDFEYTDNGNGTYTLTAWKGTLNGVESTELIIPDDSRIIL